MTKLYHFEIPSKDYQKAKGFYESLFGWKVDVQPEMGYALIHIEDGIGGGFTDEYEPGGEAGISLYFKVDDIPAVLAKAVELGGQEVTPKTGIAGGDMGYYGKFKDLEGNIIGIWSKA